MLSLVCKSSQFGPKSDEYRKFQSEAASLGRSITNRFLVICLDATRYFGTLPLIFGFRVNLLLNQICSGSKHADLGGTDL